MTAFETIATLSDSSHLTLRKPVPMGVGGKECRVIVFMDEEKPSEHPAPVLTRKKGLWVVRGDEAFEAEHALERLREERLAELAG